MARKTAVPPPGDGGLSCYMNITVDKYVSNIPKA